MKIYSKTSDCAISTGGADNVIFKNGTADVSDEVGDLLLRSMPMQISMTPFPDVVKTEYSGATDSQPKGRSAPPTPVATEG